MDEWGPILKERLAMYQGCGKTLDELEPQWATTHFTNPTFGLSNSFNNASWVASE